MRARTFRKLQAV